jgi:putative ABC transport system permease protein
MDRDTPPRTMSDTSRAAFVARFQSTYRELARRLASEPGVVGVTFGERLPRMYHPARLVDVDQGGAAPLHPDYPAYRVSSAAVDADYFDVLGAPIRVGRGFTPADLSSDQRVVIVNRSFVERVLGGRNPIGRRVRYRYFEEAGGQPNLDAAPGPWFEIIGVAPDLGMSKAHDPKVAGIYHPMVAAELYPVNMAVHLRGDPASFGPRLRSLAAAVDPALHLDRVTPVAALNDGELHFLSFWFRLTLIVSVIAIVLSLAGIYAVMAFTVSRRTREIGIRVALGSDRPRIVASIFRRPLIQVTLGVAAGGALMGGLVLAANGGRVTFVGATLLVAYALLMLGVCLLACIVPTRRALRVEPTVALRMEG